MVFIQLALEIDGRKIKNNPNLVKSICLRNSAKNEHIRLR